MERRGGTTRTPVGQDLGAGSGFLVTAVGLVVVIDAGLGVAAESQGCAQAIRAGY